MRCGVAISVTGQIGQMLKSETPPDSASLKTLLAELQRFSSENSKELAKKEDKPNLANIDPTLQRSVLEQVSRPRLIACDTPEAVKRTAPGVLLEFTPSNFVPARDLVGSLEGVLELIATQLDPDTSGLRLVHEIACKRFPSDRFALFRRRYAAKAEAEAQAQSGNQACLLWLEAHRIHQSLEDMPRALHCSRNAQACGPDNFNARYALAGCLAAVGDWS